MKLYEKFNEITSPTSNFSNYRDLVVNVSPPCIPYVGLFLSDLTFIEGKPSFIHSFIHSHSLIHSFICAEGNPDMIDNKYVNFSKCRMVSEVIKQIQRLQNKPYNLKPVRQIKEFLTNVN